MINKNAIDRMLAINEVRELFSMGDCYCDELGIVGMLNGLPPASQWIPCTLETLPEKEGSYYVIDSRGLPAYYIFTNNDFSKEYWLRCVKAWKVEEND